MTTMRHVRRFNLVGVVGLGLILSCRSASTEPIDYPRLALIRNEGLSLKRSEVMELARTLTDRFGPRLTGSPSLERAAEWVVDKLRSWRLDDARLEPWAAADVVRPNGGFPRGWTNDKYYMAVQSPQAFSIPGTPAAWTPGTPGLVRGEAILVVESSEQEYLSSHTGDDLRGKWILKGRGRGRPVDTASVAKRFTDHELLELEAAHAPASLFNRPDAHAGMKMIRITSETLTASVRTMDEFFRAHGAIGVIKTAGEGHGLYRATGVPAEWSPGRLLPTVWIDAEHYNRMVRLVETKAAVSIEAEIENHFILNPSMFNVIGELRGREIPNQVVMIGAHIDSWHGSTGATDNAAGVAVVLEAMRILKATGVPLRRTVRAAFWTGEEQGLIGSATYVRQHFGSDSGTFAGYFNLDSGTGAIRGVFSHNAALAPILRAWMAPFRDLGVNTVSPAGKANSDHASFEHAGLPAWDFIQDAMDYGLTHHTNRDSYDHLAPDELQRNAVIVAGLAFVAANRTGMLPRSAMTMTLPAGGSEAATK